MGVADCILASAQVPLLGTNWVFELNRTWLELGLDSFGTKGSGQGLDKKHKPSDDQEKYKHRDRNEES